MKNYKLYLFDLDGTILDSDKMIIETFRQLYEKHNLDKSKLDEKRLLTYSGPPILDSLNKEFPDMDIKTLFNEWREESVKNYVKYTKLFPGAYELLSILKEKNINVAIYTNKHRVATNEAFRLFGLDKLNLFSIAGDEVDHLKPNPDGIYKCMEHFAVEDKNDVLYVGDTVYDYDTAINAGVDFGLVMWTPRKLPENAKISVKIGSFFDFARSL